MKKLILSALLCGLPAMALAGKVPFSHPSKETVSHSCYKGNCTFTKYVAQFSGSKNKVLVKVQELTAQTKSAKQKPSKWTTSANHTIQCSYSKPYVESDGDRLDLNEPLHNATYAQGELYLDFCHAKDRKKYREDPDTIMGKLGYQGHGF